MEGRGAPIERGWFVTLEGPEGSGKTSQAERVATHLRAAGRDVLVTREPGGTSLGERVRDILLARRGSADPLDPMTDALLFNAARRQLVGEIIRPALSTGRTVVCARFADSTLAYQGYGAGVALDTLRSLERFATDGLTPDLTLLLDVAPDIGLRRKSGDEVTRFETDFDIGFHQRVRDGFRVLAAAGPDRFVVVDAGPGEAEVADSIRRVLDARVLAGTARDEPSGPGVRTTT